MVAGIGGGSVGGDSCGYDKNEEVVMMMVIAMVW